MRFLIYGAGALGQAIGCMLAADGHQVDLVLRPRFIKALEVGGIEVSGIFGEYRVAGDQLGLLEDLQGHDGRDYAHHQNLRNRAALQRWPRWGRAVVRSCPCRTGAAISNSWSSTWAKNGAWLPG